jgi:short-subunit dehydrogenase
MALPAARPDTCVLVTGASSGIGAELARRLAAEGHGLVLVARRADRLHEIAEEARLQHGVEADVVVADLGDRAARAELLASPAVRDRAVVGVCNNAGFGVYGRAAEQDAHRLREMVELNVDALHELTLAFLPAMVRRGEGAILNVASIAGYQPLPGMATYAATKAFVQTFSEALHAELAGTGVSCTVLNPGPVPTEFGAVAGTDDIGSYLPGFVSVTAGEVAAAGIRGMRRGRRSVVPGIATKVIATGGRLVPRTVLLPVARRSAGAASPDEPG